MKLRALAIATAAIALHAPASAWFIFLPIGSIQGAIEGNHCVSESAKPGDKINVGGRMWTVVSTSGVSSRCNATPAWPVIAKLEPYLTDDELKAEAPACLPIGASVGQRTSVPVLGEVEVRAVTNEGCSDHMKPVSVRVVRVRGAELLRQAQQAPVKAPEPAPKAPEATTKPIAERLRELKLLREQDLITQEVYEAKQRDILAGH